ncbi:MAG TPA: YjgN family protein [Bordetella sp.]|nr:YjgN family protein [Bordetella sp.]
MRSYVTYSEAFSTASAAALPDDFIAAYQDGHCHFDMSTPISEVSQLAGARQPGHYISDIDPDFAPDTVPRAYPVEFTGSGSEYFRIWITNLLLSICTLGIYSAWGKVRSQRYLHFNTRIDGVSFGYHAMPLPILIGRIVALLLFLSYFILTRAMPLLGFLIVVVGALTLAPWLLHRALRFRLANLSYRGLRFGFQGSLWKSYIVFGVYPVLTVLTAYLLTPFTHRAIKAYQHNNSTYGDMRFAFRGKTSDFYVEYLFWLLTVLVLAGGPILGVWLYLGGADGAVAGPDEAGLGGWEWAVLWTYLVMLCTAPMLTARVRNLVWNTTALGPHRVQSRISQWKYLYIHLTNGMLILVTLGFYLPFAKIRRLRYVAACTTLVAAGSVEEFVASRRNARVGAAGDETADIFGIDITL